MTGSISPMPSQKRRDRFKRHATSKGDSYGKCVRQEQYLSPPDCLGRQRWRVKYLHVTKGWRDRLA